MNSQPVAALGGLLLGVVLAFLRMHSYRGQQLMINDAIGDLTGLRNALRQLEA